MSESIVIHIPPDEMILEDGRLSLTEATVSGGGGGVWRVHMNDADTWPSNFHAHNTEDGREKLDLYTGDVYDVNSKEIAYKLKKKSMRYVHRQLLNTGNAAIVAKAQALGNFSYLP